MFGLEERVSEEGFTEVVSSVFASIVMVSLLVFSPWPMIWRRFTKTALEDYHLHPLVACWMYTYVWLMYTLALERCEFHYTCHLYCSFTGLGVFCVYIYILMVFAPEKPSDRIGFTILYCGIWNFTLCVVVFYVSASVSTLFLRPLLMVCGIGMYASPLSIIENCRKTNVVPYLPSWLCCAFFVNGASWVIIAFLVSMPDLIVTVTNGIGAMLALIELGIIYEFRKKLSNSSDVVDPNNDAKFIFIFKYFGNVYIISALVVVIAILCGYYGTP